MLTSARAQCMFAHCIVWKWVAVGLEWADSVWTLNRSFLLTITNTNKRSYRSIFLVWFLFEGGRVWIDLVHGENPWWKCTGVILTRFCPGCETSLGHLLALLHTLVRTCTSFRYPTKLIRLLVMHQFVLVIQWQISHRPCCNACLVPCHERVCVHLILEFSACASPILLCAQVTSEEACPGLRSCHSSKHLEHRNVYYACRCLLSERKAARVLHGQWNVSLGSKAPTQKADWCTKGCDVDPPQGHCVNSFWRRRSDWFQHNSSLV